MLLWIAIGLSIIFAIIKPYADGILDTSLWLAKITMPEGIEELGNVKQLIKIRQAALVEGWPSTISFGNTIMGISAIVIGFVDSWWGGIVILVILGIGGELNKRIANRPVIYFITLLSHRLANRKADYAKQNDREREHSCGELQEDILPVMVVYAPSKCKVPSRKQIAANPISNISYFLKPNEEVQKPMSKELFERLDSEIKRVTFEYYVAHPDEPISNERLEDIKSQVFADELARMSK